MNRQLIDTIIFQKLFLIISLVCHLPDLKIVIDTQLLDWKCVVLTPVDFLLNICSRGSVFVCEHNAWIWASFQIHLRVKFEHFKLKTRVSFCGAQQNGASSGRFRTSIPRCFCWRLSKPEPSNSSSIGIGGEPRLSMDTSVGFYPNIWCIATRNINWRSWGCWVALRSDQNQTKTYMVCCQRISLEVLLLISSTIDCTVDNHLNFVGLSGCPATKV